MYKPISNAGNPAKKSLVCNLTEQSKISANQLLCCSLDSGNCSDYSSNCLGEDKVVAQCHDLATFDACHRTDANAARACGWQDSLFCISTYAAINSADYTRFPKAIEWMVSRNRVEESYNITNPYSSVVACDDGQNYQLCNLGNFSGNLLCGDLFQKEYACIWQNSTTNTTIPRYPLGEVCGTSPTVTETVTVSTNPNNNSLLTVGLSVGFSLTTCLLTGACFWIWRLKRRWILG